MLSAFRTMVSVCGVAGLLVSTAGAVNMETVPVGNPGNAADTRYETPGYGRVDYTYRIGKYEVTTGQYTEFLNKVAGVDAYQLYDTNMWLDVYGCMIERYAGSGTTEHPYQYRVAADYANRPVNYVSWGDAARFANWLHNGQPSGAQDLTTTEDGAYFLNGAISNADLMSVSRESDWKWAIPSEDEWYKAAYHKNDGITGSYFDYPTCSNSVPGRDMAEATNPGNNANYATWDGSEWHYVVGGPYWRTDAGEFEDSDSPYGTFDQGGNLWEWNESTIEISSRRGRRGGSFGFPYGSMNASYRLDYDPTLTNGSMGLRVVQVPEPGSIVLVALGGMGILRRRMVW